MGNPLLADDQAGLVAVEVVRIILENKGRLPDWLSIDTAERGGLEFTEKLTGFERVIVVDSIKSEGGRVGDIYELSEKDFEKTLHLTSYHGINFFTAVELGRRIGLPMPREIKLFAIEIREDKEVGGSLTPQVAEAVKEVSRRVLKIISEEEELFGTSQA